MKTIIHQQNVLCIRVEKKAFVYFLSTGTSITLAREEAQDAGNKSSTSSSSSSSSSSTIIAMEMDVTAGRIFLGYADKYLGCYDIVTGKVLHETTMKKRPTAFACMEYEERPVIVMSDKAGEVWVTNYELSDPIRVAGHTASVITDTIGVNDMIVTSDRDEKIRVSCFPDMVSLYSYCLGHTSVITSLAFLSHEQSTYVVSSSWDKQVVLWEPKTGTRVATLDYTITTQVAADSSDGIEAAVPAEASNNGDAEKDDGDNMEKDYDESSAGDYPFKVACGVVPVYSKDAPNTSSDSAIESDIYECSSSTSQVSVTAVIFKGTKTLQVYAVLQDSGGIGFKCQCTYSLDAIPIDVTFTADNHILVLLDKPVYMDILLLQCFRHAGGISLEVSKASSTGLDTMKKAFGAYCLQHNVSFQQNLVFSLEEGDDGEGKGKQLFHSAERRVIWLMGFVHE
jgi:WD40 repeat protein